MNIIELRDAKLSPAVAYVVGMTILLYKEKKLGGVNYIIGSVNHNPNPKNIVLEMPNTSLCHISEAEIGEHFKLVNKFFKENGLLVTLSANKNEYGSISSKNGFSILIDTAGKSTLECKVVLRNLLEKIANSNEETKCYFLRGCFDGRSSIDWNITRDVVRYFSIDVDRDHDKQKLIYEIARSIGIDINLNQREQSHPKNDQIRLKTESFRKYSTKVGFFSPFRLRQLNSTL